MSKTAKRLFSTLYVLSFVGLMVADTVVQFGWEGLWMYPWVIGGGAVIYGAMRGWGALKAHRAHRHWVAMQDEVVRIEKLESLGHTQGGLSAVGTAERGMLS